MCASLSPNSHSVFDDSNERMTTVQRSKTIFFRFLFCIREAKQKKKKKKNIQNTQNKWIERIIVWLFQVYRSTICWAHFLWDYSTDIQ